MNDKKTILFILPWLPYPITSGGHQALYNGIAAVADDMNVLVTYVTTDDAANHEAEVTFLQRIPHVTLLPLLRQPYKETLLQKCKRRVKKVAQLFDNQTRRSNNDTIDKMVGWWKNTVTPSDAEWLEHIYRVCSEYNVDIAQVEMPWCISDVFAIPDRTNKVYVHHELGFVRREQELSAYGESIYGRVCKRFADKNEIGQLNEYDAVITLSAIDRQKLLEAGVQKPVHASFAIIDSTTSPLPDKGDGKRLTFIGPDSHNANTVGIEWFLSNCWQKLKETDPAITLDIIGCWREDHKAEITQKYNDVHFLGYVENLAATIRDTTMIVPITIGSGIRMKILEAANKGVPFVSTQVGAEGIPVENGKHCFLSDTPETFIRGILQLQVSTLRKTFIDNAYAMVQEHYTLAALRRNRLNVYNSLKSSTSPF